MRPAEALAHALGKVPADQPVSSWDVGAAEDIIRRLPQLGYRVISTDLGVTTSLPPAGRWTGRT